MLIIFVFSLSACSSVPKTCTGDNCKNTKYYTGSEGVRMEIEQGTPPPKIYYYSRDPSGSDFQIGVTVKNRGASFTKGGVYVSGYDPALIEIEGVNIPQIDSSRWTDCTLDILRGPNNGWGGFFGCNDQYVSYADHNNWEIGMRRIGELIGKNTSFWNSLDLAIGQSGGRDTFSIGWDDVSIDLDLLNMGAGMTAVLSNLNFETYYGKEYLLRGNTINYPGGEQDTMIFEGRVKSWPERLEQTEQTFVITDCYGYTTYASPNICIDPQPFAPGKKACEPKTTTFSGSQGAPVAITKVEQENTPYSVVFNIYISNVGGGQVYELGKIMKCSPYHPDRLIQRDFDVVYIGDVRIGRQQLVCQPDDYTVRLTNGKGQIQCTYDLEYTTARSGYMTPLIIELWYGYEQTQTKKVIFKKAG